ncbi:hypothetical protein AB834_06260 [PVC group bacterium (ex Bugula neritina AB1)]|nr:hypothetical protein AB834_06260 [PVC group bacterium (ex Bugula neritina AB1)]
MIIRDFKKEDQSIVLALIKSINEKSFDKAKRLRPFRYEDLEDIYMSYCQGRDTFAVIEDHDELEIFGTIALKEDFGDVALVRRCFVSKNYQKRGYGMRLMSHILGVARKKGFKSIELRCTDDMLAMVSLALKVGFSEKKSFEIAVNRSVLILQKKLA